MTGIHLLKRNYLKISKCVLYLYRSLFLTAKYGENAQENGDTTRLKKKKHLILLVINTPYCCRCEKTKIKRRYNLV